jgi:hypothetical protein
LWLSIWATGRNDLGLSEDEFWACTPRQFDALVRHYKNRVEHDELMTAQLIAATINNGMYRPKTPVQPKDFMPSQWHVIKERVAQKRTAEQHEALANVFRAWAGVKPAEAPTDG